MGDQGEPIDAPRRLGQPAGRDKVPLINRVEEGQKSRDVPVGAAKTGSKEPFTKEPYSPDVSAVAFGALKKDLHIDLLDPAKWDSKTAEQRWWTQAMSSASAHRDDLPKGIEIKGKASVGTPEPVNKAVGTKLEDSHRPDSLYLAGSINVTEKWDGKAKSMPAFDQNGRPLKEDGSEKYFPSVYKDGKVFDVGGQKVFEVHNNADTGLRTYLIPNPGNLKGGADVTQYAQSMVDKANKQPGQAGPVEFPMYDKQVDQNLDGLLGLGVKGTDFYIAQAKMKGIFQANEKGQRSYEQQAFEIRSRGIHIDNDPPATRLNKPFIVAQVSPSGRVFMSATINPEDFKKPEIQGIDK
jgi:hypothetical protein